MVGIEGSLDWNLVLVLLLLVVIRNSPLIGLNMSKVSNRLVMRNRITSQIITKV